MKCNSDSNLTRLHESGAIHPEPSTNQTSEIGNIEPVGVIEGPWDSSCDDEDFVFVPKLRSATETSERSADDTLLISLASVSIDDDDKESWKSDPDEEMKENPNHKRQPAAIFVNPSKVTFSETPAGVHVIEKPPLEAYDLLYYNEDELDRMLFEYCTAEDNEVAVAPVE